jgi:hypothetical protein
MQKLLTVEQEEWLVRAVARPRGVVPDHILMVIVSAGLAELTTEGNIALNDAGRQYIEGRALQVPAKVARRQLRATLGAARLLRHRS